ncbi:uncharacterized protein RHOBADRAFT_44171 [Rhodotorula graminis WP1]|uniref:Uncharacterized protein n=1 Tax=Rhodotorula graminis (strain WP1) TaxID=578459 RepID=A0A194S5G4_RHOGW|nr:uncharacterized protein RHOBADRAFT_44171 [Rhodotorula graminis WP1]KPV74656.1 hypothetical protein RHOBADRAFT_44171 [Rhodotorula graminis WP1]
MSRASMPTPEHLAQQQANHLFPLALVGEMQRLEPRLGHAFDARTYRQGVELANRLDLAVHINRLCSFFGRYCIHPQARDGMDPYELTRDKVFVLGGQALDDNPTVVVVPAFDELVHVVRRLEKDSFLRFSIPHPAALDERTGPLRPRCYIAGPVPLPHDSQNARFGQSTPERRSVTWQTRFINGEFGARNAPYQIDSDAEALERVPEARTRLLGYERPEGLRVIWTLVSPHDADVAADAEGKPSNKSATWSLELEVPGQPMAVYRVIFSQEGPW